LIQSGLLAMMKLKIFFFSLSNNETIFKLFSKSSNLGVLAKLPFAKWFF